VSKPIFAAGEMMGKAARNEQKKLRATFFNSLAVAIAMAAIFVPMIGFYLGGLKSFDLRIMLPIECVAVIISFYFHKAGVAALADLED
jgi:hypothetical protein